MGRVKKQIEKYIVSSTLRGRESQIRENDKEKRNDEKRRSLDRDEE